jgi:uncharacterized membrane protein
VGDAVPVFAQPSPRINRIPLDRPWTWLARGWRDLLDAPRVSLAYGAGFTLISIGLTLGLAVAGLIYLVLPLAAGFFLVSPILAVGLYETSRRLESGQQVALREVLTAAQRNGAQIALMGLILMIFHLAWVRIAMLLFALFFDRNPGWDGMIDALLFSPQSLPFLITGTIIGAALAAVVFGISAVSIPMLLDRDVNVFTAVATSWTAVSANWKPMALWAALIVFFIGLGLVTFYLALVVTLPLIGHATWHAYRDLVAA